MTTPPNMQDVRVDNWGNYCLQRLQTMYERGESCDLTLQFQDLQTIKVHRIVINMCTDYISNLERSNGITNGILVMPTQIDYNSMLVIIKFFYTGKLEVRGAQFSDIYKTVKLMNINILIKLLEAHARKPDDIAKRKQTTDQLVLKSGAGSPQVLKSLVHSALNAKTNPGIRKPLTVSRPLPAGVKTKTVLARVQQQPVRLTGVNNRVNIKTTASLTPKKLPIWKERRTVVQTQIIQPTPVQRYMSQKVEPPKPTRFEWPDPEEEINGFKFSQNLPEDFISQSIISTPSLSRNPGLIFDAVKTQVQGITSLLKHKLPSESDDEVGSSKMAKMSDDIAKELASMEGTEEAGNDNNFEIGTVEDMSNVLCQEVSEHTEVETSEVEVTTSEPPDEFTEPVVEHVAVEQVVESTPIKRVVKSVRFAADVEKENAETLKEALPTTVNQPVQIPIIQCTTPMNRGEEPANHSKIITEFLKKYPDVIKQRKNVRLKVVHKDPPEASGKEGKSRTSYIVLKSSSSDLPGSVVLKKSSTLVRSKFWDTEDSAKKTPSGAENVIGPWSCVPCGTGDTPEHFDSYYHYRKHLVEVHHEKVDARICEHCGIKTSKRNLLLYHLYTKHGIAPPATHHFPNCDRCSYVALSWSLLQKHKQAHDMAKQLTCDVCRASFKTSSALQYHMSANLHRNRDTKGQHQCPYCIKQFARITNLNTHITSVHKEGHEEIGIESDQNDSQYDLDETNKTEIDIPLHVDGEEMEIVDGVEGMIPVPVKILPSSEAAALTNVASSIAASLSLGSQVSQEDDDGGFTEHILGDSTQPVYILDNSAETEGPHTSTAVETMVLGSMDELDGEGDFLVQDIHGNKFRKITGTDSEGNQVVFFQLTDENGEIPLEDQAVEISEEVATTVANHVEYSFDDKSSVQNDHMYLDPQKCSIFVSSGGIPVPVSMTPAEIEQTQTLVSYAEDGTQVIELLPLTSIESLDMTNNATGGEADDENVHDAGDGEVVVSENNELSYPLNSSNIAEEVALDDGVSYEVEGELNEEHEVIEVMEASNPSPSNLAEEGLIGV